MTRGAIAAAVLILALPAAAQAAAGFATPAEAFRAGVGACQRSFEGLKAQKPFGSELAATAGFEEAAEPADAAGLQSVEADLEHRVIFKAALPPGDAAVYAMAGAWRGNLPACRVVAVRAPGAAALAKTMFEDKASGWTVKAPQAKDAAFGFLSTTYGRPFMDEIGVDATLSYADGAPKGAITALSSFTLARDH